MIRLRGKKAIAYTLIVLILFVGMCLGYIVADSVSVCAKTMSTPASIRSISGLSHSRQDLGMQEKSKVTQQAAHKSSRRGEDDLVLVGESDFHSSDLLGSIHFHSMTTVSESFEGSFSEEGIVRYLHQMDGEKEGPALI